MNIRREDKQLLAEICADDKCLVCKCTDSRPCDPPCSWVPARDLPTTMAGPICDSCMNIAGLLAQWMENAHRINIPALTRAAKMIIDDAIARAEARNKSRRVRNARHLDAVAKRLRQDKPKEQ